MDVFDWQYYLEKYPDLRINGVNTEQQAIHHWTSYGIKEGRVSIRSPQLFDWQYYLEKYPDLRVNGINTEHFAIYHWLKHGEEEGRVYTKNPEGFKWNFYLDNYPDLRKNGVYTEQQAIHHWIINGKKEGRISHKRINNIFTFPVIVCIAKLEHDYIEEFVKYHLAIGFKRIYIYDNEDKPTYQKLLHKYNDNIKIIHLPFNNYHKGVQYIALDHFVDKIMHNDNITHVAHIDIDEFIVLKKHNNISEFICEYITNDCAGIGMNWRFFGSSNHTEKSQEPVTIRFTMCENNGNMHIKTLFNKDLFLKYNSCHDVNVRKGFNIKSTNGSIIQGPFNNSIDFSVIQLNHYKCKTLPEFRYIRSRGRSDTNSIISEDIDNIFNFYNINEIEDLTAKNFYQRII